MRTSKKIRINIGATLIVLAFVLLLGVVGGIEQDTLHIAGVVLGFGGSGFLGLIGALLMHDLTEEEIEEVYND